MYAAIFKVCYIMKNCYRVQHYLSNETWFLPVQAYQIKKKRVLNSNLGKNCSSSSTIIAYLVLKICKKTKTDYVHHHLITFRNCIVSELAALTYLNY